MLVPSQSLKRDILYEDSSAGFIVRNLLYEISCTEYPLRDVINGRSNTAYFHVPLREISHAASAYVGYNGVGLLASCLSHLSRLCEYVNVHVCIRENAHVAQLNFSACKCDCLLQTRIDACFILVRAAAVGVAYAVGYEVYRSVARSKSVRFECAASLVTL